MDQSNQKQNLDQNVAGTQPNGTVQSINQTAQATPVQPVSGALKEHQPIVQQPVAEALVKPTDSEPLITLELKEAGVTAVPNQEQIQLKPEVIAAGVEPVKTAAPIQIPADDNMQLPMTEKEAKEMIKTHPVVDAVRWRAMLILEQIHRIHRYITKKN